MAAAAQGHKPPLLIDGHIIKGKGHCIDKDSGGEHYPKKQPPGTLRQNRNRRLTGQYLPARFQSLPQGVVYIVSPFHRFHCVSPTITFGMYWKECPPFRSLLAIAVPFLRNLCPGAVSCRMRSDPTRKKREKYDSRRISIICELSRYSGRSRSGWCIFLLGVKSYPLPLSHMESRVFYHPMFKRLRLNTDLRLL